MHGVSGKNGQVIPLLEKKDVWNMHGVSGKNGQVIPLLEKKTLLGREENGCFDYFLLFPKCSLKLSFSGSLKFGTVW